MQVIKTGVEIAFKRSEVDNIRKLNNWVRYAMDAYTDEDIGDYMDIEDLHNILNELSDTLYKLDSFINDRDNIYIKENE